jgi:hypothetical protein
MLAVAVEGDPCVSVPVPTEAPSSSIVTVPDGSEFCAVEGVTFTVTCKEVPAEGVVVAGTAVVVVIVLDVVKLDEVPVDEA